MPYFGIDPERYGGYDKKEALEESELPPWRESRGSSGVHPTGTIERDEVPATQCTTDEEVESRVSNLPEHSCVPEQPSELLVTRGYVREMANDLDWITEINDMLLTSQQFAVAENISDKNTAPDDVDAASPEEISVPDDDLLTD